jgi:hypothetical protein
MHGGANSAQYGAREPLADKDSKLSKVISAVLNAFR